MKQNNQRILILNAMFFAGLMLLMAFLFPKEEYGLMINHFIIAIWFTANAYLSKQGCSKKCKPRNNSVDHQE